jgi:hypothetical protein
MDRQGGPLGGLEIEPEVLVLEGGFSDTAGRSRESRHRCTTAETTLRRVVA